MRRFRLGLLAVTFGLGFSAYACGSSDASTFDGGNGDDGGNADGTLGGGEGGLGGGTCTPACASGKICSVTNVCIPTGTCAATGDCPSGEVCDNGDGGTNTCIIGGGCGATKVAADIVPPNLLITLDRSCSMTESPDGGAVGPDKWTIAVAALDQLMKNYNGKIRFGLVMFPDPAERSGTALQKCSMLSTSEEVAVGPGNEGQIEDILDASSDAKATSYPSGPCVTNIDTAIERAGMDPGLADKTRSDFILLVTDGEQSACTAGGGAAGALLAAHDLYTDAGIATFAIGFGGEANPQFLSNMAIEGGTALPDASFPNLFYNAADPVQLNAALDAIAKKTLGCVLVLGSTPPDPTKLYVFDNGDASVPRDPGHANGWDYSAATNTVTFYGGICDGLKAGTVSDVQVIYGCPTGAPK